MMHGQRNIKLTLERKG